LERAPSPAAPLDALHDEAPARLGMHAEKDHRAAEERVMTRRHLLAHGWRKRPHDRIDYHRYDGAPRSHGRGEARHHDVAFGNYHFERAEGALIDGIERARERL